MGREVNRKKQRETERVIGLNRETLSERSAIESYHGLRGLHGLRGWGVKAKIPLSGMSFPGFQTFKIALSHPCKSVSSAVISLFVGSISHTVPIHCSWVVRCSVLYFSCGCIPVTLRNLWSILIAYNHESIPWPV